MCEEVPNDSQLGGLEEVSDVSARVALGHSSKFCEVDVIVELQIVGKYLEHVHSCLDVGKRNVDSLLESTDEGLVEDPWLVRRSDKVYVEFLVLVQDPVHFLQELVPDADFSANLFPSNSH